MPLVFATTNTFNLLIIKIMTKKDKLTLFAVEKPKLPWKSSETSLI